MNREQAKEAAEWMAAELGEGWKPDFFQNGNWHAAAYLPGPVEGETLIRVMYDPHGGLYTAYAFGAHPDFLGAPPTRVNPRLAVQAVQAAMRRHAWQTVKALKIINRALRAVS